MINATSIARGISKIAKSKKFIFAIGMVGIGLTATTAITGTVLAQKHIDEAREEKGRLLREDIDIQPKDVPLTKVEILKACWKDYIPCVASVSFTVCSFTKLFRALHGENLALQGMLSASEATVQHLQMKMIDKIGEKKAIPLINDAKQDAYAENPPIEELTKPSFLDGVDPDDIIRVCVEEDRRTFKTTKMQLQKAVEQINLDLHDYGKATLNNFYYNVGQPESKIGDYLVWKTDTINGYKIEIKWDNMWDGAYVDSDGHAWTYIRFSDDLAFDDDGNLPF